MILATLLAAATAAAGPVPPPASPLGARTVRPDRLEVVVLPLEGARTTSLRVVVRAGSADDPPGKEGLAHLLEHLLLAARGPDGLDLPEAARAAGARLNAFTSREVTSYVLDAPAEVFSALAERLLRAVSAPSLKDVELSRELEVVAREDQYHGEDGTVTQLVEDALFRGSAPEGPIVGNVGSRDRIRLQDVVDFHGRRYVGAATTVVAAGAISASDLDALLERAVRLPRGAEGEPVARTGPSPLLPVNDRIRAPFLAVVLGYALEDEDRDACAPLAALLERRLLLELVAPPTGQPALRTVQVSCLDLRGVSTLVALGYTRTLDAPDLPESMQRVFDDVARRPATAAERAAADLRLARQWDRVVADPAALADDVTFRAARRSAAGTSLPESSHGAFRADVVRRVAGRAFREARRFFILFSPLEG